MYTVADILKYKDSPNGTDLIVHVPIKLKDMIEDKLIHSIGCNIDDGRTISAEQRKKCYALFADIASWTGDIPEYTKHIMKCLHMARTGCDYFSLKNCSMDLAREFINTMLEFCLQYGVQLTELGVNRTDDIGKYLWYCLKYKKCAVCGREGEIHHVDTIGMGADRRKVDDSDYRKICLCRIHHTIAHQKGMARFEQSYKVYGIKFQDGKTIKANGSSS